MEELINLTVKALIEGKTVIVKDEIRKEVQQQLRDIKKNCTIVLSQLNDKHF